MTVRVSKPAFNLREKLTELDIPVGAHGGQLLRSETGEETFKLVSGGNEQTFMVIRGFDSHSETFTTNLPEDGSWRDVYAELFGEEALAEDMPALNESIEMWGSSVVKMMYRPDLSSKL